MGKQEAESVSASQVANIVACVQAAAPAEYAGGLAWYGAFGKAIEGYGKAHNLAPEQAIALFACLSPQTGIKRNWSNFTAIARDKNLDNTTTVYGQMRRKVLDWLSGVGDTSSMVRGDKVSRFAANLAGDYNVVTIDRHAVAAATNGADNGDCLTHTRYLAYQRAYQAAAAILEITPAQAQAIAWIVWRRQKGVKDEGGIALVA